MAEIFHNFSPFSLCFRVLRVLTFLAETLFNRQTNKHLKDQLIQKIVRLIKNYLIHSSLRK